jgi:hypothetical protein
MVQRTLAIGIGMLCLGNLASERPAHAGASQPVPCTVAQKAADSPAYNQAYVWDAQYTRLPNNTYKNLGACWVMTRIADYGDSWTSFDASTVNFPNDKIQAVHTGSAVRLTLMWNGYSTADNGAVKTIAPASFAYTLGSWNKQASAARLVDSSQPVDCYASQVGNTQFPPYVSAMWEAPGFGGNDCNFYNTYGSNTFNSPFAMGFRNDSASSLWNFSPHQNFCVYSNNIMNGFLLCKGQNDGCYDLSSCYYNGSYVNGNDKISSVVAERN